MPWHLQPIRFWRFLNLRASTLAHRLHWQGIFRVAHQNSAKEQPPCHRLSWEASARSNAAKLLLPPRLGVAPSSPLLCPAGCSPLDVLALQAGILDPSPTKPPRTSPCHTRAPRISLPTAWALPKWSRCRNLGTRAALPAHRICCPERWEAMTHSQAW